MEILQSSLCLLSGGGAGVGKTGGRLVLGTSVSQEPRCAGVGGREGALLLPTEQEASATRESDNGVRLWGSPNPDTHTSRLTATLYVPEKRG